jgi:hypothetical protein
MTPPLAVRRAALLVLPVIAALAGCGGSSSKPKPAVPPEVQVRAAWRAAAVAAAAGSGTAFCARVTPDGQAKIAAATSIPCVDSIRLLGSQLTPADRQAIATAKITKVTVTGATAVVEYVGTPKLAKVGFTGRTTLTKTVDRWLLQGL